MGSSVKPSLRTILKCIGKSGRHVVAVFATSAPCAHAAVLHVRKGAPDVPVWLYSSTPPLPQTAELCERIFVQPNSLLLLLTAQFHLWSRWVSLSVGSWTGDSGRWLVKLAPLTIPPFRAVLLNENGDFFAGTPRNVGGHCVWLAQRAARRTSEAICDRARRVKGALRDRAIRVLDVASAFSVLAAAQLLRACGYPQRAWFRRMHGNQSLHLQTPPARGIGVERFHQQGPAWKGESIESLIESSDARWLLWHEDGTFEMPDDMPAPFEDDRTFAVSMQSHYRGWKSSILPMAPFEPLPPGVMSQVLAPLSRAILVDREKLLALGIPRCGLAGAAWLILFWKAAAAGWRSFSIGQSGPIQEQPDFPAVETEFFLRLLCDKELRRLAPLEPDLSRGNILSQPLTRQRSHCTNQRIRVLVVSPFLPYPLSHGGAVRIYNLCRELSGRVDFALVAIREKHDVVDYGKLHEIFGQVCAVDLDELPSPDETLPRQVRQHQSRSLRALIGRIAEEWNPDLLQIEYTHMAAFWDAAPGVPAILVEHDLTFSLYRQFAEKSHDPEAWREYERWRNFESRWLRRFDSVWTVSDQDREIAIGEGSSAAGAVSVPNGVDTDRFTPWDEPTDAPEILYVGSFRHLPNVLGFEKLCREVMPEVWSRHPNARLRCVAGPRHEDFWKAGPLDYRVVVHGYVEDLRPLYATASVVVAPLEVSAGTNIKVLEAMACGKAVVTTPQGCAGLGLIHGRDALIHGDLREFADAVCELLSDAALRQTLAMHARRTAEQNFCWSAIADRAYDSYESLLGFRAGVKIPNRTAAL